MSLYVKNNGVWTSVTQAYTKVNGVWQTVSESDLRAHMTTETAVFYKGEPPATKYVTNLLPEFIQSYWDISNITVNSWSGTEAGAPGNIIRMTTQAVNEGYIRTKSGYYPMLHVGHTYYLRWYYHKSGEYTGSVTLETFWPEKPQPIVASFYGTAGSWQRTSYVLTLNASQWTTQTTDGNYLFRFDINSNKRTGCVIRYAGPMLIDLTEDYINQGYTIPTKSELDGKSYFYGQTDITTW